MWQRRASIHLVFKIFVLTGLLSGCTAPVVPVNAPAPPITQRILVPTPQPVSAGEFVTAVAPNVAQAIASVVDPAPHIASSLTPAQAELLAKLPSRGAAPELDNATWFNSAPLKLTELRGKVVMVEFWTYG